MAGIKKWILELDGGMLDAVSGGGGSVVQWTNNR